MTQFFGNLPDGRQAMLYTISNHTLTASLTDLGAALVSLYVPDAAGQYADVVLGYDCADDYFHNSGLLGAPVGRHANRIKDACFSLNGIRYTLAPTSKYANLHSGPSRYNQRLWETEQLSASSIRFTLVSPHMDQGFPGNARIRITYTLRDTSLFISYDVISDRDTVVNLTNHSYFNLAGHQNTDQAMEQILTIPSRRVCRTDEHKVPTGEMVSIEGTPLDFTTPRALAPVEIHHPLLKIHNGYDHNYEITSDPAAELSDPISGRRMTVHTDLPGLQLYCANGLDVHGKGHVHYGTGSGVCLETQYYPNSINVPHWQQPIIHANTPYHSFTEYRFHWEK